MTGFDNEFTIAAAVIMGITALAFWRVIKGPTVFDRLLAAGAVGTNAIALLAVMGFMFERSDMFVDLALTYALLNFVGAVAAAKYLENHPDIKATDAGVEQ
jgi:multicomponent Na+:H+ antiporter subunit F